MNQDVAVGYDQTRFSAFALEVAAAEAERRGAGLTVVHAYRHGPVAWPPYEMPVVEGEMDMKALIIAGEGADRVRSRHPDLPIHPRAEAGSAPSVLADLSPGADLLVVGHRGHGVFGSQQLGSVALRTLTRAACPTIVARGAEGASRGVVLAAVDLGDVAEETLDFAFTEAAQRGARLKAVSALEILWPWAPSGDTGQLTRASSQVRERAEAALERLLGPWRAKYSDVPVEREVVEGAPTVILTNATTYADLVVVGAHRRGHGHRGVRLGPIAHTLLLNADCPVAVVPHS